MKYNYLEQSCAIGPRHAPALLLAHGWGQTQAAFLPFAQKLAERYRVITFDLAGYGGAKKCPGPYSYERYGHDITKLVEAHRLDTFHLLGWSMGGTIAARYCMESFGPPPLTLTLLSATPRFVDPDKRMAYGQHPAKIKKMIRMMRAEPETGLRAFIGLFFASGETIAPEQAAEINKLLIPDTFPPNPEALIATLEELATTDLTNRPNNYSGPTLLLHGAHDGIAPPGGEKLWLSIFPAAERRLITDAGHAPHLTRTIESAAAVDTFIDNAERRRRKKRIGSSFHNNARTYESHALVQNETADRLAASAISAGSGGAALDLGAGSGRVAAQLARSGRFSPVIGLDLAEAMTTLTAGREGVCAVQGDAEALPFADGSFSCVTSNLMLQWATSPERILGEMARLLTQKGGLFMTTLGPQTFREIRAAMKVAGAACGLTIDDGHFVAFASSRELVDAGQRAGLTLNVTTQLITKTYHDPFTLLRALKKAGAQNAEGLRSFGLGRRRIMERFAKEYRHRFSTPEGVTVTYEVLELESAKPASPFPRREASAMMESR